MHSITIYFSLPFYPAAKKTYFFNGHLAIALNHTVYQLYNPKLLKTDFFISEMPLREWLYGRSKFWCYRKKSDKKYKHVYLYGCGEALRTKVFYIQLNGIHSEEICAIKQKLSEYEDAYRMKKMSFRLIGFNCSNFVGSILYEKLQLKKQFLDFLPAVLFKRILKKLRSEKMPHQTGFISERMQDRFKLHSYCIGLCLFQSEKCISRFVEKTL